MSSSTLRAVGVGAVLSAAITASVVLSSGASAQANPGTGIVTAGVSFDATDQVIVQLQPGRRADASAFGRAAGAPVVVVRQQTGGTAVLKLPAAQSGAALQATVAAMARVSGVAWAEPDVWMTATDDRSGEQWDMGPVAISPSKVIGIDATSVWSLLPASAATTVVAVVDTGYLDHPDLADVFLSGYDFVSDAALGNDGNGRDDNAHDPGDWVSQQDTRTRTFRRCPVSDSSWHGTHVAGTIGALHNDDGINGIDPNVEILPVRVLGKCGGYTSDITDGVKWAAGIAVSGAPTNDNPAKVVNLSLGGSGSCSSTWQSAIDAAVARGTTVVVAAGNSNADAGSYSPASCGKVITVASTGKAGNRAYYSNYGSTVEIAAPGGDVSADAGDTILSTLNDGTTTPKNDTYVKYQGTSMATPHVVGVASLVLSVNPGLAPADVLAILQESSTPFPPGSTCSTSNCGDGIVNAAAAVALAQGGTVEPPPPPPPPPTTEAPGEFSKTGPDDQATDLKGGVTLSWSRSDGATQYWVCIELSAPNSTCDSGFLSGPYTGTSVKFVGLAKGATYVWDVQATNAAGETKATDDARSFTMR